MNPYPDSLIVDLDQVCLLCGTIVPDLLCCSSVVCQATGMSHGDSVTPWRQRSIAGLFVLFG